MSIQLQGVSKNYGEHLALQPIDLAVEQGEFVTLLGPSGCGKTTLLRIIAGFVRPSSGRVLLDGVDITDVPENQREVGLLFQSYALFPHMTVADNVAFGLRLRKVRKAEVARRVTEMLRLVSMEEHAGRFPRQLSGGQQQRVALARVLAIEPRVLLLDEPLAALDRKLRLQMQIELARLIDNIGITTIFVTHDQDEALALSDRVAIMDRGTVVQYDTPTAVYDYPRTAFAASFVGNSNILTGELARAGGRWELRVGSGALPLPIGFAEDEVEGPATLLIRPEHIVLTRPGSGEVPGLITDARPVGGAVMYEVALSGGITLHAKSSRNRNETIRVEGSAVGLTLGDAEACWLIRNGAVSAAREDVLVRASEQAGTGRSA